MRVSVQSVNFNIDDDLVKYTEKKVAGIEKFHDQIIMVEVFLKVQSTSEKENKSIEMKVSLPGNDIVVKKQSNTFEKGVNNALDTLKTQLIKRKEKQRV